MKTYDREKRKWVEKEKNTSLKKPKLCKGNRPHKFEIVLPSYVKTDYPVSRETIDEFYRSEKRRYEFMKDEEKALKGKGISSPVWYGGKPTIFLECSVCGKKDYSK